MDCRILSQEILKRKLLERNDRYKDTRRRNARLRITMRKDEEMKKEDLTTQSTHAEVLVLISTPSLLQHST